MRTHQAPIDSERELGGSRAERRWLQLFARLNDCAGDLLRQRALPLEVAALSRFRVDARSREDVEGRRRMRVRRANQDRIGRDAGARGDAFANLVSDANPDCENVDAGYRDFVYPVAQHERLRGEVVMDAGVAADAIAVTEHRQADRRLEFHACSSGEEGTHFNFAEARSVAPEATLAAAAMMSSRSRSSPSRHSCGIETMACSNKRSATGQSIAAVSGLAPASSTALR